ncbi:hypothetical protein F3Y22_tig00112614pilonHSYRG00123 [Hibiscus syriacus]|uniref:Uncharacterized protein n=1 Tax=Hibiscus syriacus TaxID=106335 RepID=A0A6A2X8K4_HIBSY|nr:hypothetical protein F3Y22_tig00112614pilonHSYRG00123 [Hibiscus syriacus]
METFKRVSSSRWRSRARAKSVNFDEVVGDPGSNTTYDVAIFVSDSRRKMKGGNGVGSNARKLPEVKEPIAHNQDMQEGDEGSDSESEQQMVDGILTSGPKESYELPSQSELIRLAFAGDDVQEEFEKDKI